MKRVLIVDDALELGRLLQTVLLTLDATLSILVVPSAEEALLESSYKPLDLLVSDIRLPGISGFDLIKKIRARHPALKVMVITGLTDPALGDRAREMKVEGFFRKPLDMSGFIDMALSCLEMPREEGRKWSAGLATRQFIAPGSAPQVSLSGLVTGLCQRLGALAVCLLDERGQIVVNAGEMPVLALQEQWMGPVMSALSAGQKMAELVGEGQIEQVMAFSGTRYHLVLAPAGDYALLMLLQPGPSSLRLALAVEEALVAQRELAKALAELAAKKPPALTQPAAMPVKTPSAASLKKHSELPMTVRFEKPALAAVPEPVVELSMDDFESSLKRSESELKNKDIDQFWETLTATDTSETATHPDGLTYEQARKLGLTPKEDK